MQIALLLATLISITGATAAEQNFENCLARKYGRPSADWSLAMKFIGMNCSRRAELCALA